MKEITHKEFTLDELKAEFNRLCDPTDWRNPIDTVIRPGEEMKAEMAILFYTGTKAEFNWIDSKRIQVKSPGYRNGPAGP